MGIKATIDSILPVWGRDRLNQGIFWLKYNRSHRAILQEIRATNRVRVAFVVGSLSMWKAQSVVQELMSDSRYEVKIILSPFVLYSMESQQADLEKLRHYFRDRQVPFEDYHWNQPPYDIRGSFNPHILFFMQSYDNVHCAEHNYFRFRDRLLAYIPYSLWPGVESFGFDLPFHREAWRIYYANDLLLKVARSLSLIHARNGVVVGYPSSDLFVQAHPDVWKIQNRSRKRIIWAPHFTIGIPAAGESHSSFFELCEPMAQLARRYEKELQIAFKPHPRLKTELYSVWGKERTDAYYRQWADMPNTQLETGSYIDLFMTSDALIHEGGSFIVEYLYSQQPCMYAMEEWERHYKSRNKLGKMALDLHYKGKCWADVENFIMQVVLKGDDPLQPGRTAFYRSQLLPPHCMTVAENIHRDLNQSLQLR